MLRSILILVLIALVNSGEGQVMINDLRFNSAFEKRVFTHPENYDDLAFLLAYDSNLTEQDYHNVKTDLDSFVKRYGLQGDARRIYKKLKRHYLRRYDKDSHSVAIFTNRYYNCVSGSALIAYLYQTNDVPVSINEMPYHIYLKTEYKNRSYIVESTTRGNGFLPETQVNESVYRKDSVDKSPVFQEVRPYAGEQFGGHVVREEINLRQLAGLQYYNLAIQKTNQLENLEAIILLEKAYYLYQSPRIMDLLQYNILFAINLNNVDGDTRIKLYGKYKQYKQLAME